jgi:signal recognition particle GTPase
MIGQDAATTAKGFQRAAQFNRHRLTKLDGVSRGRLALSVLSVVGNRLNLWNCEKSTLGHSHERIAYANIRHGQNITLAKASRNRFEPAAKLEEKIRRTSLHFDDFSEQLVILKRWGRCAILLGFIPAGQSFERRKHRREGFSRSKP